MNTELLKSMVEHGYVHQKKHPSADYFIYNYSPMAQYEGVWNEITMQCRGLILDSNHNYIATPFTKFFNLGEMENQQIPQETFEVYDKMDGSLGILYWLDGLPFIATRGSFESDQAIRATEMLRTIYVDCISKLDKSATYLFEIIYPENRIVLDYNGEEALYLLAIIDMASGEDKELEDIGFPVVKRMDGVKDIHELKLLEAENKEGFVIKFKSGLRYKVKFEEYLRIHRIVTQVSSVSIWEYLVKGQSFEEVLDKVPDEFYQWVKETQLTLTNQYVEIERQVNLEFKVLGTRKETALYFLTCKYPTVLFAMLDQKPYGSIIWKMLKPEFERPYTGYRLEG